MVEAIDDGRIVRVPEDYAVREGLLILRRPQISDPVSQTRPVERSERMSSGIDTLRKPLKYKQNDIVGSLVENFQWVIGQRRRQKGMTRKQVAVALGCSEHSIKLLENGILPAENYVVINRLEKLFGVTLRRDGQNYQDSMKDLALSSSAISQSAFINKDLSEKRASELLDETVVTGGDIEIFDEDK